MEQVQGVWSWLVAHQAAISPIIILVIDWWIQKNPSSPANGLLHWLELKLKSLSGQQPPQA